jgi:hypothetical protein
MREHLRAVFGLDEDVDVLRVARHAREVRKGERAPHEKRYPRVVELLQRVDVEVGGGILGGSSGRCFHRSLKMTSRAVPPGAGLRHRWRGGHPRAAAPASSNGLAVDTSNTRKGDRSTNVLASRGIDTLCTGTPARVAPCSRPSMGVPVQHHGHGIAVQRLLEAAGPQERVNFERFTLERFPEWANNAGPPRWSSSAAGRARLRASTLRQPPHARTA